MKILLLVTRSELGGAQSVVSTLASELHSRGHRVAIASGPEGEGEAWFGLDPGIEIYNVPGLVRNISPINEIKALFSIHRLYRDVKPDIVHLNTSKAALLGRLAGGIEARRIVYTMHGYFQLRDLNRKFLRVDQAMKGRCGSIVAVSRNDERLMTADGYSPEYIANGIPSTPTSMPEDPLARRLKAIRAEGLPVVMVIARDAGFKRLDLAREAARGLEGKAVIVWIGGEARTDDPRGFRALGTYPNAASYLRFADIYLQPSNHEGFSIALLEGLAAGLPCVASSVGGNIECLGFEAGKIPEDGTAGPLSSDYGILVPNVAGEIIGVLDKLCQDGALRKRMGQAAREIYESKYSSGAMADRYLSIYERLLLKA